jgi:hypothetical protein
MIFSALIDSSREPRAAKRFREAESRLRRREWCWRVKVL